MEFHIHRELRDRLDVDDQLFSYTGNVVFANVTACRVLAQKMNEAPAAGNDPEKIVNAGALFAMGLIDELNHALVERYRKEIDPNVLKDAVKWFTAHARAEDVERMIRSFVEQFPNLAVYRGEMTVEEWLRGATDGLSNREAAVEEMLMLWLANSNPAFKPFQELFEDTALKQETVYQAATTTLPNYFATRPPLDPEIGSLLDVLCAPFAASPDSLTAQLEFIREKWAPYIGDDLKRVLLAIDVVREEDIAIWMRFHPPGPDWHRHGQPGHGGEGFVGDEYVGFEEEWVTDAQGRALYFSRAPLPWDRDGAAARPAQMSFAGARRHIGIYAYRVAALHRLTMLPPSPLERRERLERRRALEHGFHIQVGEASEAPGPDVNTPEDLLRVGRLIGV